jgi:hypothetical protein
MLAWVLVADAEQVARDRALAYGATDRALLLHARSGHEDSLPFSMGSSSGTEPLRCRPVHVSAPSGRL